MKNTKISVVIITYNEDKNIRQCIESVLPIADETLVIDSFSTDNTETICNELGTIFLKHPFEGYGSQKQFAIEAAKYDMILSIDADESLSKELLDELLILKKIGFSYDAYELHRRTIYLGQLLKFCGMHNEKHLRLFDRSKGAFSPELVHEKFEMQRGKIGNLKGKMFHKPYRDLAHHLEKINQYTTLWAKGKFEKNKKCSRLNVLLKFPLRFLTVFFIKLSFLDGYAGFIWSLNGAYYSYLKYAKLRELRMNRENK